MWPIRATARRSVLPEAGAWPPSMPSVSWEASRRRWIASGGNHGREPGCLRLQGAGAPGQARFVGSHRRCAMSLRTIILYGHPTLRQRAAEVTEFGEGLRTLVEDLFETMGTERGIGLAAPQINVAERVIVVDPTPVTEEESRPLALINPEIADYEGQSTLEEGCLSIPGVYAEVQRPARIRVRYRDVDGGAQEETFADLMARVILHETDHLDGKLFVDHLSAMRRSLLTRKLRAIDADRRRQAMRL
ncbi:MAG: peptide deformylase [Candidatus Eisenbacteria bacterium]|nr:peptide deformylase [Candidatus Eisenbacteria bacterium]